MEPERSLPHSQEPATCAYPEPDRSRHVYDKETVQFQGTSLCFVTCSVFGKELLASRRPPELEDHTLSAVRNFLFNLFAYTHHIGGRSSIRNLRTRHAVVTGTHLSLTLINFTPK
jgi:hypothetical protein